MGKSWIIYRHGSNAANQHMTQVMPVCIVDGAETAEQAKDRAAESITVYCNQHLSAVSEEDCESEDWNSVVTDSAVMSASGEEGLIFEC